jgi:hypothetical protein
MRRGNGALGVLAWLLCACGEQASTTPVTPIETRDECYGRADRVLCSSAVALACQDGKVRTRETCSAPLSCVDRVGCRVCAPTSFACDGSTRLRCNDEGSALVTVEQCGAGLTCSADGCLDLCAEAAKNRSYLGCDYWPVFTANSALDPLFTPAVAIGNGNLVAAHIRISKASTLVAELDVPAGGAQTVELAFEEALKGAQGSRLVRQGAYHLTASVPVTVHQFNPLFFELSSPCAAASQRDGGTAKPTCFSYTNDASLLFPSSALARDPESAEGLQFVAVSRASFLGDPQDGTPLQGAPGFVTVVAVGDEPALVTLRSSANTQASPDAFVAPMDALEALAPGGMLQRTLAPGDVLQVLTSLPAQCDGTRSANGVFCDPGPSFDLTGTLITADAPIQVIGGHDCTNVPFDLRACDHLEESLLPLHAWGSSAIVSVPSPAAGGQSMLRVLSGADNNTISFDPPVHEPITLGRFQSFELSTSASTLVRGTGRLLLAQYLVGQEATRRVGDPSMTVAVPIDQYRSAYNFLSPETYELNFIDIIALQRDVVTLDGELVDGFVKLGEGPYGIATVPLVQSGAHEIHGSSGFGIQLYGLGSFTSYMLPGGLDLAPLAPIGF